MTKSSWPAKARGRACRYATVIKPLEICEIYHIKRFMKTRRVVLIMSVRYAIIPTITNNERRSEMNLDEYKAYVEATRKESLLKAIATMSEANDKMSSLFNTKEAE